MRKLLKGLADEVDAAMMNNCLRTGQFLPCDRLDRFVTRENVTEIINHGDDGELLNKQILIEFVLRDARKLFLILVLITKKTKKLSSWLNDFYSNDVIDKLLPIEFHREDDGTYYGIATNAGDEKQFRFFNRWERNDCRLFDNWQFSVLAPVFAGDPFHHQLHPKTILPYLELPKVHKPASGFFGEVSRVEIHKAHVPQLTPPENILWFRDGNGHGTLQIADLGLATFHAKEQNTKDRQGMVTLTPSGTSRYEPPEMDSTRSTPDARSRQYDMWSMGCVTLELLLWLVYGNHALDTFKSSTTHFWEPGDWAGNAPYRVHSYVVSCIRVMKKQLQDNNNDNTAYIDILSLVEGRLLVVAVSEDYVSSADHREIAAVLCKEMAEVQRNCKSSGTYLTPLDLEYPSDTIRARQQHVPTGSNLLEVPGRRDVPRGTIARQEPSPEINLPERTVIRRPTDEWGLDYVNAWHSSPDNDFANRYFDIVKWDDVKPAPQTEVPLLCDNCSALNTSSIFSGVYKLADLREKSSVCDLCEMLYAALKAASVGLSQTISLKQSGSTVSVDHGHDLLSIYSEPGHVLPVGTQLGLPQLLPVDSAARFQLLKQLIRECDEDHDLCRPKDDENLKEMPTRLLDIKDNIKLVESKSIVSSPYVALSHCWGSLEGSAKLCASRDNLQDLRNSIKFERLPRTFRDAMTVTRKLGMRYIWIDSLCIIQDDKQDWEYEAARMEQVFRGAYFTIAATSAKTSNDGFLTPRRPRSFLELITLNGQKVYVCRAVDNFYEDVELGELNERGWVLQERALSRRSIHFSSNQIYWECGAGIHCETLTRLNNSKAAFLGDANFPTSALEYYRDGRQVLLQDLYERYSRLDFTVPSDRSVAILGLERRLARTFKTEAIYGLFAIYFGRGLLWQRGSPKKMKHISSKGVQRVPSWSWFSKEGSIKYMNLEFEQIEWVTKDLRGPFMHKGKSSRMPSNSVINGHQDVFQGLARRLVLKKSELLVRIWFDAEDEFDTEDLRCIVIGRDKSKDDGLQAQVHALIVHPCIALGDAAYKRVGVGSLMAAHIDDEVSWVSVW
ncbi:hypothetical protein E8E14_002980 [Neopestalotiopsis sp. 37M]|nr:hypothetical protein E8E14_002980 [Neopestalotiopsis sp. 37M]